MKKKLISLFLCTSMLLGSFAGCSKDNEGEAVADTQESERTALTLSLWLPTNEGTTDEAIELVETAINKVTQAKFDTAIELHAIPRDEYLSAVDAKIAEVEKVIQDEKRAEAERKRKAKEQAKDTNETTPAETEAETVAPDETYVNELGITLTKYPDVRSNQMDIFLVQGIDNYIKYMSGGQIQQLDSELNASSKILKTYVYDEYFNLLKASGGIYAVPNNHPVGEYDYLLINKNLVDTYDYDPNTLNTFLKCQDFLHDMAWLQSKGEEALTDVTLVLGEVEPSNMNYWSVDSEWSLMASQITSSMAYDRKCEPQSILEMPVYTNMVALMKEFNEAGLVGDGIVDEGEKFAVGVLSGDASIVEQYEDDYYIHVYGKPVMETEDVFGNMFAVSTYSRSLSRSMEIITCLNTSTELRTILQYGVEDIHWEQDKNDPDVIKILSDDYSMNLLETGNVYMTYPGEGIPMSYWSYGKQQNLDCITSPYMFFTNYITGENEESMKDLAKLSASYKARIDSMTAEEFKSNLESMIEELKDEQSALAKVLDTENNTSSPAFKYAEYSKNYK